MNVDNETIKIEFSNGEQITIECSKIFNQEFIRQYAKQKKENIEVVSSKNPEQTEFEFNNPAEKEQNKKGKESTLRASIKTEYRKFRLFAAFNPQAKILLSKVKVMTQINMNEFIYFATIKELERLFPNDEMTPEIAAKLKKEFNELLGDNL